MPGTKTPRARVLIFICDLVGLHLPAVSGVSDVKTRHTRNRYANAEERPALSFRMVSDQPRDQPQYHSMWEVVRELEIDMQVDADLPTEDSEEDPTGLDTLGWLANCALKILKDDDRQYPSADGRYLEDMIDDVIDAGVIPDEDSEADEARFIHRIVVLYRTPVNDPNKLLAAGENVT